MVEEDGQQEQHDTSKATLDNTALNQYLICGLQPHAFDSMAEPRTKGLHRRMAFICQYSGTREVKLKPAVFAWLQVHIR